MEMTIEMPPYQLRVIHEYKELNERLLKLATFIYGAETDFLELPEEERNRLLVQLRIMSDYSQILQERIMNFPHLRK